jgi:uncharacterized tellurite resistance protein B-like protein
VQLALALSSCVYALCCDVLLCTQAVQSAEAALHAEAQQQSAAAAVAAVPSGDVRDTGAVQLSHQAAALCRHLADEQQSVYSELFTVLQGMYVQAL